MFDLIDRELRTQYRLAYYPDPRPPAGDVPHHRSPREVRVQGAQPEGVLFRRAFGLMATSEWWLVTGENRYIAMADVMPYSFRSLPIQAYLTRKTSGIIVIGDFRAS